jgi:1,4-dihydroxy-6-naphthoate synthase
MKLTIGFSPCPNDTLIFDALVNRKIDVGQYQFEPILEDVETLNQWALAGKLDITKLSFPALFQSIDNYILLDSGSALGKGVGPLLVSAGEIDKNTSIEATQVLLPGEHTTANLLFSFAYPNATRKSFTRFDRIEDEVAKSKGAMLGVIIHESRFTYRQKGLHQVVDLGEYWESKMKVPIPLGGIAIKRSMDNKISHDVNNLIKKSLTFAFNHYPSITDYVKEHSQAMSEDIMRKHIDLYVNDQSLSLGEEGREAILTLQKVFQKNGELPKLPLFL